MTEDTSLDAFAGEESTEESAGESTRGQDREPDREQADGRADPAVSTYDWTPGGAACADCGASAEVRWRDGDDDGGALVCPDCKEW